MTQSGPEVLLEARKISKRFPGVRALDEVDLALKRGEVLAVVGENGAGKSTLMKILAGIQQPDQGEILLEGTRTDLPSPRQATQLGIALIHQELNLADNLDVGANLYLGREPHRFGWIDRRRIAAGAKDVLARIGLNVPPSTVVGKLAIGHQQMVEIAKALSADARVLIMDEPTSSLSGGESENLFRIIGELRERGVSIVYISHRLGEVHRLADRVLVLRDGRNAGELGRNQINHDNLVRRMVGRDVAQYYARRPHPLGPVRLEVDSLRVPAHPRHPLSFQVRAGEIVGLAGLVGAGRTELMRVLFGIEQAVSGQVLLDGRPRDLSDPAAAIDGGLALAPEDRKQHGLVLEMSVRQNISLPGLRRHCRWVGMLNHREESRAAEQMIRDLNIRTPSQQQPVQVLSGGNQQKVVLGKWLALGPRVLLLDEPTRGIDVGAKQEVYTLMERLAEQQVAIVFASSEMEEVLGMSDRVLVMHEGRLAGELARQQLSEKAILHLATGGAQPTDAAVSPSPN